MEADGLWGVLILVVIMLLSLWIFFDVLGFTPGAGGASPH